MANAVPVRSEPKASAAKEPKDNTRPVSPASDSAPVQPGETSLPEGTVRKDN